MLLEFCKWKLDTKPQKPLNLVIIKKSGGYEVFDPDKLKKGILRACEKRPVKIEQIDDIVENIESKLRSEKDQKVKSEKIGDLVMRALKKLDRVAYIRFASVYKDFQDIKEFGKEIKELK